jgi:hypothetical protein
MIMAARCLSKSNLTSQAQRLPAILLTGFAKNTTANAVPGFSGTFSLIREPIAGEELAKRVAILLEGSATAAVTS